MTDANVLPVSLIFSGFSIEVRVDEPSSVDFTKRFNHHGPDYAFAVAELWLHQVDSKHLIVPATYPENSLERLKHWRAIASAPPTVQGIEEAVPCGGWGRWITDYWDRVDNECNSADDEQLYELLSPLSIVESRVGHAAMYVYAGKNIFEVVVRQGDGREVIGVWAQFNSEALRDQIGNLIQAVTAKVQRAAMKTGC